MAYTLGNKCAKNCCKRTILVQVIIVDVVTCFFGTQCRMHGVATRRLKKFEDMFIRFDKVRT